MQKEQQNKAPKTAAALIQRHDASDQTMHAFENNPRVPLSQLTMFLAPVFGWDRPSVVFRSLCNGASADGR